MTPLEELKKLADAFRRADIEYRRTWNEMTEIFRGAYHRRRVSWCNYFEAFGLPRNPIVENFTAQGLSNHNDKILIRINGGSGRDRIITVPVELFYADTIDQAKSRVSEYMDCLAQWATNDKEEALKIEKRRFFKQLQEDIRSGRI